MKARFSAEYTIACSSCGTRKELKMPAPSGDMHFALASVDVAHAQVRRWLIDHAKTCEGNALVLGPQTAADVKHEPSCIDPLNCDCAQYNGQLDTRPCAHKSWCAFFRTATADRAGDCDCGAV